MLVYAPAALLDACWTIHAAQVQRQDPPTARLIDIPTVELIRLVAAYASVQYDYVAPGRMSVANSNTRKIP